MRFADAYPKARHHALVVARDPSLVGPADLRRPHIPLLEHMRVRDSCAQPLAAGHPPVCLFSRFLVGHIASVRDVVYAAAWSRESVWTAPGSWQNGM